MIYSHLDTTADNPVYAYFQSENGRPNSSFLHLGNATRKAFAAGLHKGVNLRAHEKKDSRQREITLWALYYYETYVY